MVNDESFQISDPAKIAEVDRFGSNPEFLQDFVVQQWSRPCSYAALWGATREREREREVAHEGESRGELFQGAPSIHECPTLLQGFSFYRRVGGRLTPPPRQGVGS
jgi:hypothetical protein